jgi:hypothetical protein
MAATWQYLTEESSADLVTFKTHSGHQMDEAVAAYLPTWLAEVASIQE